VLICGSHSGDYEECDLLRMLSAPPALFFAFQNGGDKFVHAGEFIPNYTVL
jgi:hypothetical protein